MTGFFAEGRFPQGRREAAGKQTRLVTGRAHTQTAMAATNKYLRAMAAPDKCLAQSNKSRTGGEATKKREISQSSLVGNGVCGRCAVSVCQSAGKRCTTHFLRNWTTPNMSMAATNKSLARNDKSRTWVEPTKKRTSPTGVRRACRLAALRNVGPGTMAAMNKSLARSNKSRTWVEPTKKRRTPTGVRRRLAALRNVGPGTMAAMNKSLARSNKSRTWVEPT